MNEIVVFVLIFLAFIVSWSLLSFTSKIFKTKILIAHLIGIIGVIAVYFIASLSVAWWAYDIMITILNLSIFPAICEVIFEPFNSFIKIRRRMMNNPEQRINYKIFKEIFNIDPKSFKFDGRRVYYIDEKGNQRIFYSSCLDLFRILRTIENYETKGINSNTTPITDDMMKKIRKEHERAEKEKQEAIKGLTELSKNWDKIELK